MKRTQNDDTYIQSGIVSDAFTTTSPTEEDFKFWETQLSDMLQRQYTADTGVTDEYTRLGLASKIKKHVDVFHE
jgi:hypothetical protein